MPKGKYRCFYMLSVSIESETPAPSYFEALGAIHERAFEIITINRTGAENLGPTSKEVKDETTERRGN